jgi:hypothetical protein
MHRTHDRFEQDPLEDLDTEATPVLLETKPRVGARDHVPAAPEWLGTLGRCRVRPLCLQNYRGPPNWVSDTPDDNRRGCHGSKCIEVGRSFQRARISPRRADLGRGRDRFRHCHPSKLATSEESIPNCLLRRVKSELPA